MTSIARTVCIVIGVAVATWAGNCVADELLKVTALAGEVTKLVTESVDPLEVEIDAMQTEEELTRIEQVFEKITEIRGLLANCRRCFVHVNNAELRQLHSSVNLSRSEFLAIQSELKVAARKSTLDICQDRLLRSRLQKSGWSAGTNLGKDAVITLVENALLAAAKKRLDDGQAKRYESEVVARREYRQRAVVEAMAASLDSRLFLSPKQRESMVEILMSEWQDSWLMCLRGLLSNGIESMPMLPKQEMRMLLSPPQETLFAKLPWNPQSSSVVGPSEVIQSGHEQRNTRLEQELTFAAEERGEPE